MVFWAYKLTQLKHKNNIATARPSHLWLCSSTTKYLFENGWGSSLGLEQELLCPAPPWVRVPAPPTLTGIHLWLTLCFGQAMIVCEYSPYPYSWSWYKNDRCLTLIIPFFSQNPFYVVGFFFYKNLGHVFWEQIRVWLQLLCLSGLIK